MTTAFVGLGSNKDKPENWLTKGREAMAALPGVRLLRVSPVYHTEPQGLRDQPWFANQVVCLECSEGAAGEPLWQPESLLAALLAAESRLGRVRAADPAQRNGPRCIDLDLLLFGNQSCPGPACIVPHPRMAERAFVLVPLRDIAPEVSICGQKVTQRLQALSYSQEGQRIRQ